MNGETLSPPHGYPLRLIVPGWYAVASVKWLTEIVVTDQPCEAYYQAEKYWYHWVRNGHDERAQVKLMNVRALISSPEEGRTCRAATPRSVGSRGRVPGTSPGSM